MVTKGEMRGRERDELGDQVWHIHTFMLYIVVGICRFPGGSDGKESARNAGDPPEKGMATHSTILPGKFHGHRNLVGYSPWGPRESDTTEWLTLLLLHRKEIANKDLLYSTANSTQYSAMTYMRKDSKKEWMYV